MSLTSNHRIDRSRVNETTVQVANLPRSGFNRGYKSYSTFRLGTLHVGGFHHVMPADKFRGSNAASLTFFDMNQPNISDVNISQHNFYVTYRSIDDTWEDAFAPTPQNSMSASWKAPSFQLSKIAENIILGIANYSKLSDWLANVVSTPSGVLSSTDLSFLQSLSSSAYWVTGFKKDFEYHYLLDWFNSVYLPRIEAVFSTLNSVSTTNLQSFRVFVDAILFPFIGEGSLLDEFGYIYVRRSDLQRLSAPATKSVEDVAALFNSSKQNEYAIRAYYTIWYEYYRDNNLEPKRSSLSNWHDFSSTTLVYAHPSLLVNRFRSWGKDVFTTSMPDDIMRHVFAPVLPFSNSSNTQVVGQDTTSSDYANAENSTAYVQGTRNIGSYQLQYRDPVTNTLATVTCPLPRNVNDSLKGTLTSLNVSSLDLYSLRNAQSLERYLKRNFYFGDEYRDRMLAHYGSYVSDFRVNRPEFLSSSLSPINPNQVVSNVGTEYTQQGARNITATATTSSDNYEYVAEEFGIVINLISIMPVAQYAGVTPQNLLLEVTDFPVPEFAANNEEFSRTYEIGFSGIAHDAEFLLPTFGHHPYAHSYRARVNEVHKEYLSDLQEYTFRRFFGMDSADAAPKLNSEFIHCKPNLGMFVAGHDRLFTPQVYGVINHTFYVESVLPTPVETI